MSALGLWAKLAQRHIVDHALAQRADGLVRISHGSISCVVGCCVGTTTSTQVGPCCEYRCVEVCAIDYRASGLVRRPKTDIATLLLYVQGVYLSVQDVYVKLPRKNGD